MSNGRENPRAFGSHGVPDRSLDLRANDPEPVGERAWLERARQATDPAEALAALNHVLEMNPARLAEFHVGDRVRFEQVFVD